MSIGIIQLQFILVNIANFPQLGYTKYMKYNDEFGDFKFSHKIDQPAQMISGFQEHFHPIYEFLLFIEGDVEYAIENRRYKLKPFDLLFIKPGEHHYVNILSERKYDRMVFRFPESLIPKPLVKIMRTKPNLFKTSQTQIVDIFRKFDQYYTLLEQEKRILLYQAMLIEILVLLSVLEGYQTDQPIIDPLIEEIIVYIHEHISEDITIETLCNQFFISKSQLYKSFNDAMKVPIANYIRNKRILQAHQMIESGYKPTEVFEQCGFDYYSTFYRSYYKVMGFPPSAK
jgi:AraC-like DNA-binding protein